MACRSATATTSKSATATAASASGRWTSTRYAAAALLHARHVPPNTALACCVLKAFGLNAAVKVHNHQLHLTACAECADVRRSRCGLLSARRAAT